MLWSGVDSESQVLYLDERGPEFLCVLAISGHRKAKTLNPKPYCT